MRQNKSFRPKAECLESRLLLASVTWDGEAGDFLWTSPTNWSNNEIPGTEDKVTIPEEAGEIILNGRQSVSQLTNHATIWIQGRSGADVWRHASLTASQRIENHGTIQLESLDSDWAAEIKLGEGGEFVNESSGVIDINKGSEGSRQITGKLVNRGLIDFDEEVDEEDAQFVSHYVLDGGSHIGVFPFEDATIEMTDAGTEPVNLYIQHQARLVSDIPNHVTLLVQGNGDRFRDVTLFVDQPTMNHGVIRLDSLDSDWDVAIDIIGDGELTNSIDGTIEIVAGEGGDRTIRGKLTNEGTIEISADTTISSEAEPIINEGVIAINDATLSLEGESFANILGAYIGGNGIIDRDKILFIDNAKEVGQDLALPAVFNVNVFQSLIVVDFLSDSGMEANAIENTNNYSIVAAGEDGEFDNGDDELHDDATIFFDDQTDTVFLLFEQDLPEQFIRISFVGDGLRDNDGDLLRSDGRNTEIIRNLNFSVSAPPDQFELNPTPDRAKVLDLGTTDVGGLTIHHEDDTDWFRWTANDNGTMVTKILSDRRFGDVDFSVYDGDANLIARSLSFQDSERITFPVAQGDEFLIETSSYLRQVIPYYEISFEIIEDIDKDGIPDLWETKGVDLNQDGVPEYQLVGADPTRRDVFIEVDAMAGRSPLALDEPIPAVEAAGLSTGTVIDRVIEVFLQHDIRLHVDIDETDIPLEQFDERADFSDIRFGTDEKEARFGTAAERQTENWTAEMLDAKAAVYRYALFADRLGRASGIAANPGVDFAITLGNEDVPGGTADQQAGAFMHELGHTLGLQHGGGDNINYKPNYYSVMNYHWQFPNEQNVGWELRFSDGTAPSLDETALVENQGLGFDDRPEFAENRVLIGDLEAKPFIGPIDFNRNGTIDDQPVPADINRFDINGDNVIDERDGSSPGQLLHDHDDWKLRFIYTTPINLRKFGDGSPSMSHHLEQSQTDSFDIEASDEFEDAFGIGNNDIDDAVDLSGELNPSGETDVSDLTIHEAADEDWFSVSTILSGTIDIVVNIASTTLAQFLEFSMVDADGNEIMSDRIQSDNNGQLETMIQAGTTTYLRAHGINASETIPYAFNVKFTPKASFDNIDRVCSGLKSGESIFNPNQEKQSEAFVRFLRKELEVVEGDWNLEDSIFNSADLVQVFQSGEYEDGIVNNSTWKEGDLNCDGEFDSSDLVTAFEAGGYSAAAETDFRSEIAFHLNGSSAREFDGLQVRHDPRVVKEPSNRQPMRRRVEMELIPFEDGSDYYILDRVFAIDDMDLEVDLEVAHS